MNPSSNSAQSFHIPSLDGIRAVAFLLVFLAHAGLEKVMPGGLGVTIFFFLSGYLITTLLRTESGKTGTVSLRNFYIRRAFRILPPMYLTLALASLITLFMGSADYGHLFGLLAALFYVNNYSILLSHLTRLPIGMGVLWSLAVEEHFYVLFPAVYLIFVQRKLTRHLQARILIAACMVALAWRLILALIFHMPLNVESPWTYISTDCRFDSILWGCILALRNNPFFADRSPRLTPFKGRYALGGLLLIAASLLIRNSLFRETLRYSLQAIALYPIFYYCVGSSDRWQVKWLEWRTVRRIGYTSYSLYLIHLVLLIVLRSRYPNHPSVAAAAAFGLAMLYAALMRYAVELPLRQVRDRIIRSLQTKRTREAVSSLLTIQSAGSGLASVTGLSVERNEGL